MGRGRTGAAAKPVRAQAGPRRRGQQLPTILIRPARPQEFEALGELTVGAYLPFLSGSYAQELRDVATRAALVPVLVAVHEDVVGSVTYVPGVGPYAEFDGDDEAGIRHLAVAPVARGRGVGAALVRACITRANEAGKKRVALHTTPRMHAAQRLYTRLGFQRAPERDFGDDQVTLLGYVREVADVPRLASGGTLPDRRI